MLNCFDFTSFHRGTKTFLLSMLNFGIPLEGNQEGETRRHFLKSANQEALPGRRFTRIPREIPLVGGIHLWVAVVQTGRHSSKRELA